MFIWKIRKRSETKFWVVRVLTKAEFDQDWTSCRIWWWHQDLAERFPTSDEQRSPHNHDVMMMRRMRRIMITIITLFMIMQTSSWWSDHWEDDGQMHQDHGRQQRTQLLWSGISSMPSRSSDCTFSQCLVKHCIVFSHNIYLVSFSQGCSRCLVALYIIWHCDLWGARGEDKRLVRCFESQGGAVSGTRQDLCTYSASRLL